MIVINAVTSHAAISSAGEPSPRDISADTMKMPDPIIEPITIAVAENSPIPCTNCGAAELTCLSFCSETEVPGIVVFEKFTFRLFYPNISRKSLATFSTGSPSTNSALITATESAPASITLLAFARVIPPIATIGFSCHAPAPAAPHPAQSPALHPTSSPLQTPVPRPRSPHSSHSQSEPVRRYEWKPQPIGLHRPQPAHPPATNLPAPHAPHPNPASTAKSARSFMINRHPLPAIASRINSRIPQHLLRAAGFIPILQQLHPSRSQFLRQTQNAQHHGRPAQQRPQSDKAAQTFADSLTRSLVD